MKRVKVIKKNNKKKINVILLDIRKGMPLFRLFSSEVKENFLAFFLISYTFLSVHSSNPVLIKTVQIVQPL